VKVTGERGKTCTYRYSREAELLVKTGDPVEPGERLIARPGVRLKSEIAGTVSVKTSDVGEKTVTVSGGQHDGTRKYRFTKFDEISVEQGASIEAGQPLVKLKNSFGDRFLWRVRPHALLLEMTMRLDGTHSVSTAA
jgi:hypothetical protein